MTTVQRARSIVFAAVVAIILVGTLVGVCLYLFKFATLAEQTETISYIRPGERRPGIS